MEFSAALCAVWLCLNCILQCAVSETNDVRVRFYNFTSPKSNPNEKLISEVKEFDQALEELIISNQNIYESLSAAQPASALLKRKNELEPENDPELEKDVEKNFQTTAPSNESQVGRKLYEDKDLKFADLFSLPPPIYTLNKINDENLNRQKFSQSETRSGMPNEVNNRNKTEDKISNKNKSQNYTVKGKNESSNDSHVETTVKPKVQRRQTRPMDYQGQEVLKLLKEDVMDSTDDLENLEEILDVPTEEAPSDSGHFKGIDAKYLLKLLSQYYGLKRKAENIVDGSIEAIKEITSDVIRIIKEIGG